VVCNTGVSLAPTIDGQIHHFFAGGLYDGLAVLQDTETGTLWNHVTGEAMHGPLMGSQLGVSNLLQMNVAQALEMDPGMRIAISDQPYSVRVIRTTDLRAGLSSLFEGTLGAEDERRDRMELGIGVWKGEEARFYPMASLRQSGSVLLDEFDGREILLYIDPSTSTPAALYLDVDGARKQGREIWLSDGSVIRSGVLYGPTGEPVTIDRPFQLFTRWYGFSLTFPDVDIYTP
jgi:Protein of unknown function (DUF3179)